ncbi:MAG: hypothetical protein R3A52_26260 [Polyangiales bacterium]
MRLPLALVAAALAGGCADASAELPAIFDAGVQPPSDAGGHTDAFAGQRTDASLPDAGLPDAGLPDASLPDAGLPDAGLPDAGATDAGATDAGSWPGPVLRRLNSFELPNDRAGTPHGSQLLAVPEFPSALFVADSYGGLLRYDRGPSGWTLTFHTDRTTPPTQLVFCNQVTLHPPSATAYCAGLMSSTLTVFDANTGALRASIPGTQRAGFRGVARHGPWLYLAAVERGLLRRAIASDGALGEESLVAEGTFVGVVEVPGGVIGFDRHRGLRFFRDSGDEAIIPLPGPALNARMRDGELWVAMGSRGVARVRLDAGRVDRFDTSCMATAVEVHADALVVGCRQGLRVYPSPAATAVTLGPLRSNSRADFGVVDVLSLPDGLHELDWRVIRQFALDPRGPRGALDIPLALPLAPGRGARFEGYNPFDAPMTASGVTVGARASAWFDAPRGAPTFSFPSEGGEPLWISAGETALYAGGPLGLPLANAWVYFTVTDCALQWPDLEDFLWIHAHGGFGDGRGLVAVILGFSLTEPLDWYRALWSSLPTRSLAELYGMMAPPGIEYSSFLRRYDLARALGGPDSTIVLSTDAAATIEGLSNQYRGPYQLAQEHAAP